MKFVLMLAGINALLNAALLLVGPESFVGSRAFGLFMVTIVTAVALGGFVVGHVSNVPSRAIRSEGTLETCPTQE